VRAGTYVSATWAVCTPTKEPGDGSAESRHRKVVRPRPSDPSEGDYYLKPRLSWGFFMSAIHPLRKHLVRVVLESQDHHRPDPPARPLTDGPELATTHSADGCVATGRLSKKPCFDIIKLQSSLLQFIYAVCCSVPLRPASSRRASQPKPTSPHQAVSGCTKSSTMAFGLPPSGWRANILSSVAA
jgi:hypothetical protein